MTKIKLSATQIDTLKLLRRYPNEIVMDDGWLTGGHGVRLGKSAVAALKDKELIERWGERRDRISELGKSCEFINTTSLTPKQVNKLLADEGYTASIVKGNGYYYFDGDLFDLVPSISSNNLRGWAESDMINHVKTNVVKNTSSVTFTVLKTPISERYCKVGDVVTLDNNKVRCGGAWFDFDNRWSVIPKF